MHLADFASSSQALRASSSQAPGAHSSQALGAEFLEEDGEGEDDDEQDEEGDSDENREVRSLQRIFSLICEHLIGPCPTKALSASAPQTKPNAKRKGKGKGKANETPDPKKRFTKNDSLRLVNAIAHTKGEVLESETPVSREDLDAGLTKRFWQELVPRYMEEASHLDKVLYKFEGKFEEAGLSPKRTGWQATASLLEEHYKKHRKLLNNAMGRFRRSGNGDGGPVEIDDSVTQYSSKFLDFCDGDIVLEYMYTVFLHHGLLEFACSDMPSWAVHDSTSGSTASSSRSFGSAQKDEQTGLVAAIKEAFGSTKDKDDPEISRKRKADADTAELRAQGAKLELYAKTSAQLDIANADLASLEGKDDETSNAKRRRLTSQISMLEASLDKLLRA